MSEPRNQHYVPQTYLKNFSFSSKPPHQIFVLHKDKGKIFCVNIRDTASERHFYTVTKKINKYFWENKYSQEIEPIMTHVISDIISKCDNVLIQNNSFILTSEIKQQLAFTMVNQLLRGKHCRDFQHKIYESTVPPVIEAVHEFIPIDNLKEELYKAIIEDRDYFKLASMQATFDIQRFKKYCDILFQRHFLIYKITGDENFITSDNPVMFIDTSSLNALPFSNGLAQSTTAVYFPISPKFIVAAYHPKLYFGALSEFDGRLIYLDGNKERAFIQTQNKKQYEQCYNQIYAETKTELEFLR
jgi:hypothetical protein